MNAIKLHRIAHWFYLKRIPIVPTLFYYLIFLLFNSSVPASVIVGKGTKLGYGGIGVVIHARAVLGDNVVISQNVTIGGRSGHETVPVIHDDVFIGAGAVIIGPVVIGKGAQVGANAVVLKDVPENAVVGGIPAKLLK